MPYEEFVFHAIQKANMKTFSDRFRIFNSREQRDRTFDFLQRNGADNSDLAPVVLSITVRSDEVEQLKLNLAE